MTLDIVDLDARAVRASEQVVAKTADEDLARPTPCAGWTLADLLVHMTAQHDGFAAAATGEGANLERWRPEPRDPATVTAQTLVTDYLAAAGRVLDAFAAAALDQKFSLPELSAQVRFPARQAIGFHFIDYVVHGWDVARSLDVRYDLDPEVLDAAVRAAEQVPGGERRLQPGAAFAPAIPPRAGHTQLDTIVALLGRRPEWPALP